METEPLFQEVLEGLKNEEIGRGEKHFKKSKKSQLKEIPKP